MGSAWRRTQPSRCFRRMLAQRLRVSEHIDRHVPKRGTAPTVGTYLPVAILNRCVAPCAKASIGQWFQGTALRRLIAVEPRQL